MTHDTIVLIGPMGAGKTTIGECLSKRLNRPWVQMDEVRFDYYREAGYDDGVAREKHRQGRSALIAYWKPFEAYAVERILPDHPGCVLDFGAGHSVYDDQALFARVEAALAPYSNVILLLPTPDLDESLAILNRRLRQDLADDPDVTPEALDDILRINQGFLRHPSNSRLAKFTVYTAGKTPEQTCADIAAWIKDR
jgi:SpoVK/Ycf46/Vps4 family AAA+-type ATPase